VAKCDAGISAKPIRPRANRALTERGHRAITSRMSTVSAAKAPFDPHSACQPNHPAVMAWMNWQRVSSRINRLVDAKMRELGINQAQLMVLLSIGVDEGLTQQQLSDSLGLTRANVSQLLDRMQDAGLIERLPSGRAYALHLTPASHELLARALPAQEAVIASQFETLSAAEQAELGSLMSRLNKGCCSNE
jgi:DNA-binding MarR family transcriptional regulator